MSIRKYQLLLFLAVWIFAGTGCAFKVIPTVPIAPTAPTVQQEPTATVFIGIPEISNPLVQAVDENVEEFVVRIATTNISFSQPVLIALTQVIDKELLWRGVSPYSWDVQKCWIYETNVLRLCTSDDIQNYFRDQNAPKIFFAPAFSDSTESLFILDYYHRSIEQYPRDIYRLVIELKDDKWVEKSISPGY